MISGIQAISDVYLGYLLIGLLRKSSPHQVVFLDAMRKPVPEQARTFLSFTACVPVSYKVQKVALLQQFRDLEQISFSCNLQIPHQYVPR